MMKAYPFSIGPRRMVNIKKPLPTPTLSAASQTQLMRGKVSVPPEPPQVAQQSAAQDQFESALQGQALAANSKFFSSNFSAGSTAALGPEPAPDSARAAAHSMSISKKHTYTGTVSTDATSLRAGKKRDKF
jgi:hypothetical protein